MSCSPGPPFWANTKALSPAWPRAWPRFSGRSLGFASANSAAPSPARRSTAPSSSRGLLSANVGCLPLISSVYNTFPVSINPMMEGLLWILLPGFVAVAAGLLAWFVMQSRMEVLLADQRTEMAEIRGSMDAEKAAVQASMQSALRAAEEATKRQALDNFLSELRVDQRHYTRENRLLLNNRKSLVLQERMYFRNIPLSDWIEHEIQLEDGADVERLVKDMTVFENAVVSIADIPRPQRKALA